MDDTACWYAITTKPHLEWAVTSLLHHKQFDAFLPVCKVRQRSADRIRVVEHPVFPGYTFCFFSRSNRTQVLQTPGTRTIVRFGGQDAPVDPVEIASLRKAIGLGRVLMPEPFLQVGEMVRVEGGALDGVEGTILKAKTGSRLVLSVTLLQRSLSLEVDRDLVSVLRPKND